MGLASILIIDDEIKLRGLLARILSLEGFHLLEARTGAEGLKILGREEVHVVICDVKLPDCNGVDFAKQIKAGYPEVEVIVLTAFGTIRDGVKAIQNGAFDYLTKGDDNDRIIPLVNRAIEKATLQRRVRLLETRVAEKYSFEQILGSSPKIREAISLARKVAPTDAMVLLTGETGTGKEVFAQAIHQNSSRASKPFVAVNAGALSGEILESELFGHKAGAFTGAVRDKKGLFEEARDGTIFLDEIGEMDVHLQAKLLRVLEAGEYIRVGDTKTVRTNVRVIAATNRDLRNESAKGAFRLDLYYRLSVFEIHLPSLRERSSDIPLLAEYFVRFFSSKMNKHTESLSKSFIQKLVLYDWRGNIRELKNVLERAVILSSGEITEDLLPFEVLCPAEHVSSEGSFDLVGMEKRQIQKVMQYTKGNKAEAARLLNIGLTTLYRKMEKF